MITAEPQGIAVGFKPEGDLALDGPYNLKLDAPPCTANINPGKLYCFLLDDQVFLLPARGPLWCDRQDRADLWAEPDLLIWRTQAELNLWLAEQD